MFRLTFLMLLVFPLSSSQIGQTLPVNEEFFKGLELFEMVAKKHLADKSIPDMDHWKFQRKETINTLKDLRTKLDNVCFYLKWAKVQDSGWSILCRLAILAEYLLRFLPINVDSFMCPAAQFRKQAASIIEHVSSPSYQNDLQDILIKDMQISSSLNGWLQSSQNLKEEVQNIFGFDLKSKNSLYFVLLNEFYRLFSATSTRNVKEALELMKRGKCSIFLEKDIDSYDLLQFSKYFKDSPKVSKRIQFSLSVLSTLVSAAKSNFKVYQKSRKELMSKMIPFICQKLDLKILFEVKPSDFISLIVLDIIKDITSFQNDINVVKDDDCPYTHSLKHIIDILELELTFIETSFSLKTQCNTAIAGL